MTIKMDRNVFFAAVAVVALVVVLFLGKAWGADRQKKADAKTNPFTNRTATDLPITNRWTSVGTVTEISDSKIKVKDSRDQTKEAAINKDTKIVNRKGEDVKVGDIKKDSRVIISGTKDAKDDKKLTATRIRLQQ